MQRRHRQLSEDERRLWRAAMRGTEPLRLEQGQLAGDSGPAGEKEAIAKAKPARSEPPGTAGTGLRQKFDMPQRSKPKLNRAEGAELDRQRPVDIDRSSWKKLKSGDIQIDGRLDLHGLTQTEAHERLNGFIMAMQAKGARCVLIITGVGRGERGILRQMTPRWLSEPANRDRLVTYTQAQLKHGGAGALYVLLKRRHRN